MSDEPEQIIIEPYEHQRTGDAARGQFLLYDEDFPEETDPRRQPIDPTQKLYRPHFSVGEIAPWVFGRNMLWLRNQLKNHPPHLNRKPLTFRWVTGRGNKPQRFLTLPDIERLAWALYQRGAIDGLTLQRATQILVAVAHQYGALVGDGGKKIT